MRVSSYAKVKGKTFVLIIVFAIMCLRSQALDSLSIKEYNTVLQNLKVKRALINSDSATSNQIEEASQALCKSLQDSIFPAWYETKWDFNGISNIPQEGFIACGYFVSTTLKHAGFNLNRYRLAQQAAEVIIKEICGHNYVTKYDDGDMLITSLSKKPDGLYVLGLDYHVGFVVVEKGKVFFVHSDYVNGKVIRQLAEESEAYAGSTYFVLGQISNNKKLLNAWIKNSRVYG